MITVYTFQNHQTDRAAKVRLLPSGDGYQVSLTSKDPDQTYGVSIQREIRQDISSALDVAFDWVSAKVA
jgi:hypothetical protein